MRQVVIVGGGASGMMAAIMAAREGAFVTILEQKESVGKKILMTGNGRCNMTNTALPLSAGYPHEKQNFLERCFLQFDAHDTIRFFEELGMMTKKRGTLVYPITDYASTVREMLLMELKKEKVKIKCAEKVVAIEKKKSSWIIKTKGWQYEADSVILASGSKAAAQTGSDGSGYELARSLGLKVKKPLPALVPLKCRETMCQAFAGIRTYVRLRLAIDGKEVQKEEGELQWTEYGISGIVVFQVSANAVRALEQKKKTEVWIDLCPFVAKEEILQFLKKTMDFDEKKTAEEVLLGIFPKKMVLGLLKERKWNKSSPAKEYSQEEWSLFFENCKNKKLTVTGTKSFENAQICCGGVELFEVSAPTLESRRHKGLYLAGELLDIDGICGGYNLQWAWTSGYLCGIHAAKGK